VFIHSTGAPFPKDFRATCKTVLRRLFRIYGHIYASHFDQICALGIEGALSAFGRSSLLPLTMPLPESIAHLNTNYRHFLLFVTEFNLVDKRELQPLEEFNNAILTEVR
jgi:MOB kinase activator 1